MMTAAAAKTLAAEIKTLADAARKPVGVGVVVRLAAKTDPTTGMHVEGTYVVEVVAADQRGNRELIVATADGAGAVKAAIKAIKSASALTASRAGAQRSTDSN